MSRASERATLALRALLAAAAIAQPLPALANPEGGVVQAGDASIAGQGTGVVDVHQTSQSAVLSWQRFDIAPGEVTSFHQPNASAVALNRILDGQASQILGSLHANGHVYLINPNGIVFGGSAQVNVHALVAATGIEASRLATANFDPSATAAPGASVENHGQIRTDSGGFVYLVAPHVENAESGVIVSPEGEVTLAAGATVYLTDRADGLGLQLEYTAPGHPGDTAVNLGKLVADAGIVRMRADLVVQSGIAQANSVRERDGKIELVAASDATLTSGSTTRAVGDVEGISPGGRVEVASGGDAHVEAGAEIDVSGGAEGGDGGSAEVSAHDHVALAGEIRAGAAAGWKGGEFLADPTLAELLPGVSFSGAERVAIESTQEIVVGAGTRLALHEQAGSPDGSSTLALRSDGDVRFESGGQIVDDGSGPTDWSVEIDAGRDVRLADGSVEIDPDTFENRPRPSGVMLTDGALAVDAGGDVVLGNATRLASRTGDVSVTAGADVRFAVNDSNAADAAIESGSGDVSVTAGGSVSLGTFGVPGNAAIRTRGIETTVDGFAARVDGGDVFVQARGGDVFAGNGNRWLMPGPNCSASTCPAPYDPMAVVRDGILGIGGEVGGNVTVLAAGNVWTGGSLAGERTGGSASGESGRYDGGHIGVFGRPYTLQPGNSLDTLTTALGGVREVAIPDDVRDSVVLVVAGGDVTGEFMVRGGTLEARAGFEVPAGLEQLAAPDLLAALVPSPRALADPAVGWVGTTDRPITVDLIEGARAPWARGTAELVGQNGVAIRAIENPTLVYRPPSGGERRVATWSPDDLAWLEAARGDVALLGDEIRLGSGLTALARDEIRILPPSLVVRTHAFERSGSAGTESRRGDMILLNDFVLAPSPAGGLTLDVAGKVRTASPAAESPATVSLTAQTRGGAEIDRALQVTGPIVVENPETGIRFTIGGDLNFAPPEEPFAAQGTATFVAEPSASSRELVIPQGTRLVSRDGQLFQTDADATIPAPELRQATGTVSYFLERPAAEEIVISAAVAQFVAPDGTVYRPVGDARIHPGERRVDMSVRADRVGVAHAAGSLQLVGGVGGAVATNLQGTVLPAEVSVPISALEAGLIRTPEGNVIDGPVTPIPGIEIVRARFEHLGADKATFGNASTGVPNAIAEVIGPAGALPSGSRLVIVDAAGGLPEGTSAENYDIAVDSLAPGGGGALIASIYRSLRSFVREDGAVEYRIDAPEYDRDRPGEIGLPDNAGLRRREDAVLTAELRQSDAAANDRRGRGSTTFAYADYFRFCHSGVACAAVPVPALGSGPTHAGDATPASLVAAEGFQRVAFDLAEPALLRTDGDAVDLTLRVQHDDPSDFSELWVPFGDLLLGARNREYVDRQAAVPTTVRIGDDEQAGFQVAGPGSARVLVGVQPFDLADVDGDGVITPGEFAADFEIFDALDRHGLQFEPPTGTLTPEEAPYVPTGRGGRVELAAIHGVSPTGTSLGVESVGNLRNAALPTGGADVVLASAGDVVMNVQGSVASLQGGDLRVESVGGALVGPNESSFTGKRGIVSLYFEHPSGQPLPANGGDVNVDTHGTLDIGASAIAGASGGDMFLRSRDGDVTLGAGDPIQNLTIDLNPRAGTPSLVYSGAGVSNPLGNFTVQARRDVNIGAGVTAAGVSVLAGGSLNAGTGAISASGNVNINVSGSISGNISSSTGAVSIGGGTVSASASVSAGTVVTGGGALASATGASRVSTESTAAADPRKIAAGIAGAKAGAAAEARRGLIIDVSSRECERDDCS